MSQLTKKAISAGFIELLNERPFDKISVVDIAEKCGITRNTFYYYYSDIYELVDELLRAETDRILNEHLVFSSWGEAFMKVTAFAQENRRSVFHLYKSANRERVEKYLYDVVLMGMTSYINETACDLAVSQHDVLTLAQFYTAALIGLMLKWLQDDMAQSADVYIKDLSRLIDGNIRISLERAQQNAAAPESLRQNN